MGEHGWMVRAGSDNELIEYFIDHSIVAIGWEPIGDVSGFSTRDELRSHFATREEYANFKEGRITTQAGQVFRFSKEIVIGDYVITYDKDEREYHLGTVTSEYEFNPLKAPEHYPHVRHIEWQDTISREGLSTGTKNTLGTALTVFSVDSCLEEILAA